MKVRYSKSAWIAPFHIRIIYLLCMVLTLAYASVTVFLKALIRSARNENTYVLDVERRSGF